MLGDLIGIWTGGHILRELIPLVTAGVLGFVISLGYVVLGGGRPAAPRLAGALVIVAVIMCLIVRVVDDLASAFIVVGALTLLRLRAAIEDTREFSFLLLSVAVGMGIGEGEYLTATAGALFTSLLAVVIFGGLEGGEREPERRLRASVPLAGLDAAKAMLAELGAAARITGVRQLEEGYYQLRARLAPAADDAAIVSRLGGLAGVRDLEIRTERNEGEP